MSNDRSFSFCTRSNSLNDMYCFDNLLNLKSSSFLIVKNLLKWLINEFEDNLWGFLIFKYFAIIFNSFFVNISVKSNVSARDPLFFSCESSIPLMINFLTEICDSFLINLLYYIKNFWI